MKKDDTRPISPIIALCVMALLIATFAVGVARTLEYVNPELQLIRTYPEWSYDEKMHHKYGAFYDLMRFVQQQTPPDSTILIPPAQDTWYDAGNFFLVQSFLYPRKIQPGTDDIVRRSLGTDNTYMLIATGHDAQVWPSQLSSYGNVRYIQAGWGIVDLSKR
jgi:hypothetical protein